MTKPNENLYKFAKKLAKELLNLDADIHTHFGKAKRWTRGDGEIYYEAPIKISLRDHTQYKDAEKSLQKYIIFTPHKYPDMNIYYFPKYKVYGRLNMEIDFGRNRKQFNLDIFGKTMFQNMKRDMTSGKLR